MSTALLLSITLLVVSTTDDFCVYYGVLLMRVTRQSLAIAHLLVSIV